MKNNAMASPVSQIRDALLGKLCWYVSCGGAAGSTFELALGAKRKRPDPHTNPAHPEEFRQFEGEANLLVWCTWRLDDPTRPVTSSDDEVAHIEEGLDRLQGTTITDVKVGRPGWDLQLTFSNDLTLRVFCDHMPGDPSFDGNWELWREKDVIFVEVGSECWVVDREATNSPKESWKSEWRIES